LIRIVPKQGTQGGNNLISFGGKQRRRVRGIGGQEQSGSGEEKLNYLSSLWESHLLIKLSEDFQVEWGRRFRAGYLHHLVDILWGDEKEDVPR
jgi:hypothetical protein